MRCSRIYNDEHGESHIEDVEIELSEVDFAPPAAPLLISRRIPVSSLIFCTIPDGWDGDWHPSPARQYFVLLSGEFEVELTDGEVRRVSAGSAVLLEDTTGRGHVTRVIGGVEAKGLFLQLEP